MSQHQITLERHFRAPPAAVFAAMADHETFGQIWPGRTQRIREGEDAPNGVGSVRRISVGPISLEETTITHEPDSLIEYTITRGSPLRNHHGRIALSPQGEGTQMHYVIRFECRIPLLGGLIARQLERDFHRGVEPWAARLEAGTA